MKLTLNRYKQKAGFSLFEACVVMMIVAIFFAVSANVIPKRNKPKAEAEGHGRFECYYKNGKLVQQMFQGTSSAGVSEVTECRFNPPVYAKYIVVNAVGGGAGGSGGSGGEPGQFYSSFHTSARAAFIMKPGRAGAVGNDGTMTAVYYEDVANKVSDNALVLAEGGLSKRELKAVTARDIKQCAIEAGQSSAGTDIACGSIPLCEVQDDKIKVSYCFSSTRYKSKYIDLQKDIISRPVDAWLKPPEYNDAEAKIIYHDQGLIDEYNLDLAAFLKVYAGTEYYEPLLESLATSYPSLFKMTLTFDLHRSNKATPSLLSNYLDGMGIESGITEVMPGQGGAPGSAGRDGAVLITW